MTVCIGCGRSRALRAFGLCHTCYVAMRRAAVADGTWESIMVPADRTRAHVRRLAREGYSYALIAHLARVDEGTVERVGSGRHRQVMLETEERICGVPVTSLWVLWHTVDYPHRMPVEPVVRRIQALAADGWTYEEIGAPLNWSRSQVWRYVSRPPARTTSTTARAVDAVYRSPEFAVPVRPASPEIAGKGWPLPLEWDDIDLPGSSKAARGRAARRLRAEGCAISTSVR